MGNAQKLSVKGLFIASGLLWGGNVFFHALLQSANINLLMWNAQSFVWISQLYPGVTPTIGGAILGLVWGFFCGGVAGAILAWLYNKFI